MKKTVKIEDVIGRINKMILDSPDHRRDGRIALSILAEDILMDANRFRGFRYLDKDDMELSRHGKSVGVRMIEGVGVEYEFEGQDGTRVEYKV